MEELKAFPFGPKPARFHAAFGVGSSADRIHPVDACGVMLASVQALHQLIQEQDHEIEALRKEIGSTLKKALAKRS
jgi:hypothetical protein